MRNVITFLLTLSLALTSMAQDQSNRNFSLYLEPTMTILDRAPDRFSGTSQVSSGVGLSYQFPICSHFDVYSTLSFATNGISLYTQTNNIDDRYLFGTLFSVRNSWGITQDVFKLRSLSVGYLA